MEKNSGNNSGVSGRRLYLVVSGGSSGSCSNNYSGDEGGL